MRFWRHCGSSQTTLSIRELPQWIQRTVEETCFKPTRPAPKLKHATARGRAKRLDEIVLAALPFASRAASPAFNLDDHYRLAAAILAAVEAAPESFSADILEVGSFQGHTALFTASVASQLVASEPSRGIGQPSHTVHVHAVEHDDWPNLRRNLVGSWTRAHLPPTIQIQLHQRSSKAVGRTWDRPLRMLFEDSAHNYNITKQSFDAFTPFVIEGGLVLLHDVGCCASQFPGMMRFVSEWLQTNGHQYTELELPRTPEYEDMHYEQRTHLLAALARSIDFRTHITKLHVEALLDALPELKNFLAARNESTAVPWGTPPPIVEALAMAIERAPAKVTAKLGSANCTHVCLSGASAPSLEAFPGAHTLRAGYTWSTCRNVRVFRRQVRQAYPLMLRLTLSPMADEAMPIDMDLCKLNMYQG